MKHTFRSNEIAHAWVHRLAPYGHVPQGAMSFDQDDCFLSYSTCIGQRLTLRGRDYFFIVKDSYSTTTSGHQAQLRRAIPPGAAVFHVSGGERGTRYIIPEAAGDRKRWARSEIQRMHKDAGRASLTASRAREPEGHAQEARDWLTEARNLASLFKVPLREPVLEQLTEKARAESTRRLKQKKALQKARDKDIKERLERWHAGDLCVSCPRTGDTYLRVRRFQDDPQSSAVIETSKGIRIPYEEARLALSWLLKHRDGWRRNGETFKIAGYNVDSVSESGVVAGCHHVRWGEIERIAKLEGWMK